MIPIRILKLAGIGLVGAALAAVAVGVTASAAGLQINPFSAAKPSSSAPPASTVCQDFLNNLAGQLKVSPAQLAAAAAGAAGQTVDDLVKQGKLSATNAAALKSRIAHAASTGLCSGVNRLGRGHHRAKGVSTKALLTAAASALGMTPADLKADLAKGMTLHQVADSKGVSEAKFRQAVIAALKPQLDAAVAAGKMKQAREDSLIARLQSGPIPFWDKPMKSAAPAPRTGGPSPTTT